MKMMMKVLHHHSGKKESPAVYQEETTETKGSGATLKFSDQVTWYKHKSHPGRS
jgi:hypothetical protein